MVVLLAQAALVPPLEPRMNRLAPKLFSSASAIKIFTVPPDTTRGQDPPSRGTRTRARGLVFQWRAWCRCSTSALVSHAASHMTASVYFLFALYCSAPPAFFIGLQSLSGRPLSSAAPGRLPRSSACCSGRISCPRLSQARWRRRALREDHTAWGQPPRRRRDAFGPFWGTS